MRAYSENINVVEALKIRLMNLFDTEKKLYLSFSGGKESLVLAHAIMELHKAGKIDFRKLSVMFIDEEAIYDCVERIVYYWKEKFESAGAKFLWLCMPFKHYNCFNSLYSDESFILFEPGKESVWIRKPPKFAVRSHKLFKEGDTYQKFTDRIDDGRNIIGIRADESVQRKNAIAAIRSESIKVYPIYDWNLNDVWKYLLDNKVEIPDAYLYMWKVGVPANKLRISQFFSIDTAMNLVKLVQFYPGLYEKILKREPNAYLAMHYFDSSMFRRTTATRKELEARQDWKEKFYELFNNYEDKRRAEYQRMKTLIVFHNALINALPENKRQSFYRKAYDLLEAGDPKARSHRTIMVYLYENRSVLEMAGVK